MLAASAQGGLAKLIQTCGGMEALQAIVVRENRPTRSGEL
jgi:hypothetical protein